MRNVSDNPLIYGAAIAFEPFSFHEDKRLFAPYVHQSADNLAAIDIGEDSYDYSDGNWEWYSAVRKSGEAVWTEPYFDEGAGDVLMTTFSAPFFRDGNFAGVATLAIRLDTLNELTAREFGDKNFIILSQSGRFISHYNSSMVMNSTIQDQIVLQNNASYSIAVDNILAGESSLNIVNDLFLNGQIVKGESWIYSTPVSSSGWTLIATTPRKESTKELWSLMSMGIYGLILMITLIIALTLYASSRMTRPIKQLADAVSSVARGKLDTTIEKIYSMDELGKLSVGFNRMLKNLNKQVELQSQQTAARQVVEKELQMARETQQALLPSTFPLFPQRQEFQLHAVSKACMQIRLNGLKFFF